MTTIPAFPEQGDPTVPSDQMLGLAPAEKPRSMFRRGLEVFVENKLAVVALGVLLTLLVAWRVWVPPGGFSTTGHVYPVPPPCPNLHRPRRD